MKGTHKHREASLICYDNLCRVFTYIYSLLIEKDICDCCNACLYVPFIRRSLHFFVKSFLFSYFCVIRISALSLSTWYIYARARVCLCPGPVVTRF